MSMRLSISLILQSDARHVQLNNFAAAACYLLAGYADFLYTMASPKRALQSQSGSVFIPLIIVGTIIAILFVSALSLLQPILKSKLGSNLKGSLRSTMSTFRQCVHEGASWAATLYDNGNPAGIRCSMSPTGCTNNAIVRNIRLHAVGYTGDPRLCVPGYDPLQPSNGFSPSGAPCNRFSTASPTDACPYRVEFHLITRCPNGAATCTSPIEEVVTEVKTSRQSESVEIFNFSDGINRAPNFGPQSFAIIRGTNADSLPMVLLEKRPAATAGGTCPAGGSTRRMLNHIQSDPGLYASVDPSSGIFTLKRGTYDCTISVPGYNVGSFRGSLINMSTGTVAIEGTSEYSSDVVGMAQARSTGERRIELTADSSFELVQYCSESAPPPTSLMAMGVPAGYGQEVYAVVMCMALDPKL